ncbi:MAG: hypothetical protein DI582_03355 [Azospirillum brasilense]|nr:MAG: hypothetical protein DI582_03355 [Azospirillum brasilense]
MSKRRSLGKRLLASKPVIWLIAVLASLAIRALYYSNRRTFEVPETLRPYADGTTPAIFCFWHGRMIMQPFLRPPLPMHVLISQHRDGVLISTIMQCFGIRTVAGSRSKGAANAMRGLLAVTGRGENVSITPDGPRGPFQQAANGAAFLASHSGHPIIAVTFSASRHTRMRSWDKFMMPRPFGRIAFVAEGPFFVPANAADEAILEHTAALEATLNRITEKADALCGVAA